MGVHQDRFDLEAEVDAMAERRQREREPTGMEKYRAMAATGPHRLFLFEKNPRVLVDSTGNRVCECVNERVANHVMGMFNTGASALAALEGQTTPAAPSTDVRGDPGEPSR